MTETLAPVSRFASLTLAKIGTPSKSSPAFFGFTPATKQALPLAYSRQVRVWNCPVLPVIPCVITRLFLSIRMLIVCLVPALLGAVRGGDDLLGGFRHRVRRDDRQSGVGEDLLTELLVRSL